MLIDADKIILFANTRTVTGLTTASSQVTNVSRQHVKPGTNIGT